MKMRSNPDFFNGVPEMLVLHLISEGEKYGYELVRLIRHRSKGRFSFGEGCIYPILHALTKTGALVSRAEIKEGRWRRYYRITPKGRRKLTALVREWRDVTSSVASALKTSPA